MKNLSSKNIITENQISITEAIKSVVIYDATLEKQDIDRLIDNLHSSKLFEPLLAYYGLIALEKKSPITIYNVFSEDKVRNLGESVSGRAHSGGEIETSMFPINDEIARNLTYNLFSILEYATEFKAELFTQGVEIFFSEPNLPTELKNPKTFYTFIKSGLLGYKEKVLFHEITHQVMREVFNHEKEYVSPHGYTYTYHDWAPYFNNDTESKHAYHNAICDTLKEIKNKYLPNSDDSCENLWNLGRNLKIQLLGPDTEKSESHTLSIDNIIHGLRFFGKGILGYTTLLSAFSSKIYSAECLDAEFIPRLPELEFIPYSSEETALLSMPVRQHYCQYIMPAILHSIEQHPLHDRIIFDSAQDFGCEVILGHSSYIHDDSLQQCV